jgi:hypothetical protein
MSWFKATTPAPPPPTKAADKKYERRKDQTYGVREDIKFDYESAKIQLMQDLRDELKALNKKLDKMDENFRLVFGVEEKDGEG